MMYFVMAEDWPYTLWLVRQQAECGRYGPVLLINALVRLTLSLHSMNLS
jgi:hypothetical protein